MVVGRRDRRGGERSTAEPENLLVFGGGGLSLGLLVCGYPCECVVGCSCTRTVAHGQWVLNQQGQRQGSTRWWEVGGIWAGRRVNQCFRRGSGKETNGISWFTGRACGRRQRVKGAAGLRTRPFRMPPPSGAKLLGQLDPSGSVNLPSPPVGLKWGCLQLA